MRFLFKDLAIIALSGVIGTIEVIFLILRWLSTAVGAVVWSIVAAIVGLGMLSGVILTALFHWSYGRGHMTAQQWHFWLIQFGTIEIFGLLFFGATLGGAPAMLRASRMALRRRLEARNGERSISD